MDAFDEHERQQQLQALIQHLFQPSQPGEATGKRLDPLAQARGTATPVELMVFLQSPALREATEKYLHEIGALWLGSKNQLDAVQEMGEMPVSALEVPTSEPAPAPVSAPTPTSALAPASAPEGLAPLAAELPVSLPTVPLVAPAAVAAEPPATPPLRPGLRPGQIPPAAMPLGKPAPPRIQFQLPNARVGQPYAARLEGKDSAGNPVTIRDARLPAAVGLSFDAASGEMRGTPLVDGDYKIALRWSSDGVAEYAGECLLFVNPDPRSLWKQLEPPAGDPYFKPHTDAALIAGPGFQIAAASRRGRSHEHVGSFRDDDFFVQHDDASGWSLLIVADGAGSAKNSRWGSKLAVQAAGEHITAQLSSAFGAEMTQALAGWATDRVAASNAMHAPFYRLFQAASKLAVQAIEQEADSQGAAAKDYATTLLAAVVRRDGDETFLATFWMGDGAIAAYGPQGKLRLMGKPDSGEFAGQTRFLDRAALTDPDFGKRLGFGCYSGLNAVLLMTDGISDPRFETDNGLADAARWDALWDEIGPLLGAPEPQKALTDWLTFFTPGHHDDRTIAVLW